MKITKVNVFRLKGPIKSGIADYHDRRWTDVKVPTPHTGYFCEICTDEGFSGVSLITSPDFISMIKKAGGGLIGEDPMRIEYLWEKLYSGTYFRFFLLPTISVIDLALWDLVGKARGEPVFKLLNGPTRDKVRAYASMLFYDMDPESAAQSSAEMVEKGFTALKWYLPYGPGDGVDAISRNEELIAAVRDAVGDDVDIMVDCLFAEPTRIDILFATKLLNRLEKYHPLWIEEPLNFDDLDAYASLAGSTSIPVAMGEHWHTRWQIKQVIEKNACIVIQPDPIFAGGITEMRKIIALCSAFGKTVIPHANESCISSAHLLFAQEPRTCPLGEWNAKINADKQYFFKDFYEPVNGYFLQPPGPGFGIEIDYDKVIDRKEL